MTEGEGQTVQVIVGVGSNIDPERNVARAREIVAVEAGIEAEAAFRETEPVGPPGQPPFLNGAWLIETALGRVAFRDWLHDVEARLGRRRTSDKFAPRTIDLDILVWDGEIVDEDVWEREYLRELIGELSPGLFRGQT